MAYENVRRIYARDAQFQKFEALLTNRNKRRRYGEFIFEGVRNINEAVGNGWHIASFLYARDRKLSGWAEDTLSNSSGSENFELPAELMAELSGKDEVSELMAVAKMKSRGPHIAEYSGNPIIALLDRPSNKGNLGTTLRSCDAFGVDELVITGRSVDAYDKDVIAASMGSFFKVPFAELSENAQIDGYLNEMKARFPSLKVIGTTAHKKTDIYELDLSGPVVFLIGSETEGLNWHLAGICDETATIPMSEFSRASSLNASCAAAVTFYEASRQRSKNPGFLL